MRSSTLLGQYRSAVLSCLLIAATTATWSTTAQAQRPLGIDVSAWQGEISQEDWHRVYREGNRQFAIIRITHFGATNGDPDTKFAQNIPRARAAGLLVGTYHYAIWSRTPQVEAEHFLQSAAPYITAGYLPPMLDLEAGGNPPTPTGATSICDWARQWLEIVKASTGVDAGVYMSASAINPYGRSPSGCACGSSCNCCLLPRPLWVADWCGSNVCNACGDMNTAEPEYGTNFWPTWTFWQYCSTGSVPGIVGNCDQDIFNGTMAELENTVIGGGQVPPVILNVQAVNVSDSGATITWVTHPPSTSQVEFGLTAAYGNSSPLDSDQVVLHSVQLSGLAAGTTYHYRVTSTGAYGTSASSDLTFTTCAEALAPPTDLQADPPTLCAGQSAELSAVVGVDQEVEWFTDGCGERPVQGGPNPTVSPLVTTTYYARTRSLDGACASGTCTPLTLTVYPQAVALDAQAVPSTICTGQSSMLTATVGEDEVVDWFVGSCFGEPVPGGANPTVAPTQTTVYQGQARSLVTGCVNPQCVTVRLVVNSPEAVPSTPVPINGTTGVSVNTNLIWSTPSGKGLMSSGAEDVENIAQAMEPGEAKDDQQLAAVGRVEDTIGSPVNSATATGKIKGNFFQCTSSTKLVESEFYLNLTTATTLRYFVYEAASPTATQYNRILDLTVATPGNGERFYSSGPISVSLVAGKYYAIGVGWAGTATFWYDTGHPANVAFGSSFKGLTSQSYPPPVMVAYENAAERYHQRLTTDAAAFCDTTYDLYLDTVNPPAVLAAEDLTDHGFIPPVNLLPGVTYYWKVLVKNCCGTIAGPVWSFTTCVSPPVPTNPLATPSTICPGQSSVLSVTVGSGITVEWFTSMCGGSPVSGGPTPTVSPTTTTIYYARARTGVSGCISSTCVPLTVTVSPEPAPPSNVLATPAVICAGETTTLTASSGANEVVEWFTGSCGQTLVPGGSSPVVAPSETTMYYARTRSTVTGCGRLTCVPVRVLVFPLPSVPSDPAPAQNADYVAWNTNLTWGSGALAEPAVNITPQVWTSKETPAGKGAEPAPAMPVQPARTGGPDAGGYSFIDSDEPGGPAFDWIDVRATGTNLNLTDDSVYWPLNLPFAFDFYGTNYTQVSVHSNGGIGFVNYALSYSNECIPSTYESRGLIALYWDDLYPGGASNVYYQLVGAAPHRILVVQWHNVPRCCGTSYPILAQVQLHEGSNDILMLYANPSSLAGFQATVGIQKNSSTALQYSCNQQTLHSNLAIRFSRDPECPVTYDVYLDTVNPPTTLICSQATMPACQPPVPLLGQTSYFWKVAATNCCGRVIESPVWSFSTCGSQAAPTAAQASPAVICEGQSTVLSASVEAGFTVDWFTQSCGGTPVPGGATPSVSPSVTTTYYAQARNVATNCQSAACDEVTVVVNPAPAAPTGVTADPMQVCAGQSTILSAVVGPGQSVEWFTGSCGGTAIGTGASIQIIPESGAVYFARTRNELTGCTSLQCASLRVNIESPPAAVLDPGPADGATGVSLDSQLSWRGADLYREDFNDGQAQGWEEMPDSRWQVAGGQYVAFVDDTQPIVQSTYADQTWQDVTVQFNVRKSGSDFGYIAVLIRASDDFSPYSDTGSAYLLAVQTGYFALVRVAPAGILDILDWTPSPHLNPDASTNLISFTCVGTTLRVAFNGHEAWTGTDNGVTGPGRIGLWAFGSSLAYYFDDVIVTPPASARPAGTGQPLSAFLPATYDVYFGTDPSTNTLLCSGLQLPTCDPGPLALGATYYWKVVSHNECGDEHGPVWSFSTSGDCNRNGVDDRQDILSGTSTDCDSSGIPDECERGPSSWLLVGGDTGQVVAFSGRTRRHLGEFLSSSDVGAAMFSGLIAGSGGEVYAADEAGSRVLGIIRRPGEPVRSFGGAELSTPAAVALRGSNRLLVASRDLDSVMEYDLATGALLGTPIAAGSGGLEQPGGILVRPDGRILVSSQATHSVLEYSSQGAFLRVAASGNGLSTPSGLLLDAQGNLLVASAGSSAVLKFSPDGSFAGPFVPAGSAGLSDCRAMTWGPNGNLFVVSRGTGSVMQFRRSDGAPVDHDPVAPGIQADFTAPALLDLPTCLAFLTVPADADQNGVLDACQPDADQDAVPDFLDNCPQTDNLNQIDSDGDATGDACVQPSLIFATSRLNHGSAGPFDRAINKEPGQLTIEGRETSHGPLQLVLIFTKPVQPADGQWDTEVAVTGGATTIAGVAGNQLTAQVTGVADLSCLAITLTGLIDLPGQPLAGTAQFHLGVLWGDMNGDGRTNIYDLVQTRALLNQPASLANFRADIDVNGQVDVFDLVRARNMLNRTLDGCP